MKRLLCAFLLVMLCACSVPCFAYANNPVDAANPNTITESLLESDQNSVNQTQVPDSSFLYDMSIDELAGADPYYDGQTVQVVGEVVGDRISAGPGSGYYWIVLASQVTPSSPTTSTITVYMNEVSAGLIDNCGEYGMEGTVLQVRGAFHLSCKEHQGFSDIHAETVSLVDKSHENKDDFNLFSFIPGIVLVVLAGISFIAFRYLSDKQR